MKEEEVSVLVEAQMRHQPGAMPTEIPMESFNQNVIKHKTGLLNVTAELGNISKACKLMGFSPDPLYRYQAAIDAGGAETLFEVSRVSPT